MLDHPYLNGHLTIAMLDEVLYHARVHPEHRCHMLSEEQVQALQKTMAYVCQTAVAVNADASKFPEDWLFNHRWVRTGHH